MIIALSVLIFSVSFAHAIQPQASKEVLRYIEKPVLSGKGLLSFFLFDVYDIALWVEQKPWNYEQQFALSIHYKRNITRQEFIDTSIDELKNYYPFSKEVEKRYRDVLSNIMPSVSVNDRISAIYTKEKTLAFYKNGSHIGTIENKEFARMYVQIWLHPKVRYRDLRNALLGK